VVAGAPPHQVGQGAIEAGIGVWRLAIGMRAPRLTLDEVQRVPELMRAIKRSVDDDRRSGRLLLTGSADLLLMHRVPETLAGHAQYRTLGSLTLAELRGEARAGSWSLFFSRPRRAWAGTLEGKSPPRLSWQSLALRGGYPTAAVHTRRRSDREQWFAGYALTYLERDLQQLAAVQNLPDFRRLMRAVCLRLGNLLNQAEIARDVGLSPTTAQRHLNLLEVSQQLVRLPAYAVNRTKRLTESPKLFWTDTGLGLHLAAEREPRGAHLENVLLDDLLVWRQCQTVRPEILYWRTTKGTEIDLVIEWKGRLLPIEVKASNKASWRDTKGLRVFLSEYPKLCRGGLLIHDGEQIGWLDGQILAAPWWAVLS